MKDLSFLIMVALFAFGLFYVAQLRYELGVHTGRLEMLQQGICRSTPVPKKSSYDYFPAHDETLPPIEISLDLRGLS